MPARRAPRKKPAQSRSKGTVDAILTAAARVLERDGYARAGVNRIAEVAGVSVGSLYQYFPTKEALAAAVAQRLGDEMLGLFQAGLGEAIDRPFDEAIRAVSLLTVRSFRVNPRLREVIVEELPESVVDHTDFDERFTEVLESYLAMHRERIRPKDLGLAAVVVASAVEAAAIAAASRGNADEEVAEELEQLILGYLVRR